MNAVASIVVTFASIIAPYVGDQTVAVLRVNVAKIDVDVLVDRMAEMMMLDPETARERSKAPREWVASFVKAGGGDLYLVSDLSELLQHAFFVRAFFVIVPVKPGADADALVRLIGKDGWPFGGPFGVEVTARMGDVLFAGSEQALERLRVSTTQPVSRPELAQAFGATEDTTAQLVIIPTDDNRRVIEEMMPTLPAEIGDGSSTAITRGMRWAALSVNASSQTMLKLQIQSQDEPSAKALHDLIGRVLSKSSRAGTTQPAWPNADEIVKLLTPELRNDRLTLMLNDDQINALIKDFIGPVRHAREQARRALTMSNVRSICTAVVYYAEEHKGQWPSDLLELVKGNYVNAELLVNPRMPEQKVGYVYIRPQQPLEKNRPDQMLVHEKYDKWDGSICVGFAGGYSELIGNEAHFKEMLGKTVSSRPAEP
jgi:hypothetical protein